MTKERATRLYLTELKWDKCGTGDQGRNKGKSRAKKKARQHQNRLVRLCKLAEAK